MYMPYINVTLLWQTVSVNTQSMYQCVINNKLLAIYQSMQQRKQQHQAGVTLPKANSSILAKVLT